MGCSIRSAVLLALILAVVPARATDIPSFDWAQLVDKSAQDFEDPYRDLTAEQLSDLGSLVRYRARLTNENIAMEARLDLESWVSEIETDLKAAGIDVEWLLAQRWIVAERREKAFLAVNSLMDDRYIEIGGYLIPAPPEDNGVSTAYLVPERGMCSHTPPPPPNQLLRLVLDDMPEDVWLYTPAVVRGTLRMEENRRAFSIVDGPVQMWSAWTLEAENLELIKFSVKDRAFIRHTP